MDLLRLALEAGASPNERSSRGSTILMTSALQGELETLKLTHKHGADVDLWDLEGKTAVMHAVIGENKECVEYLLDAGQADVTIKCLNKIYARELGLGDICDKIRPVLKTQLAHILEHGPREVDNSKGYNIPPCLWGRHNSRPKTVESLCQATENGDIDLIRQYILKDGIDCNEKCRGTTALAMAAGMGSVDAVRTLLELNADPNVRIRGDETALSACVLHNQIACAELLIQAGSNINFLNSCGISALTKASSYGFTTFVRLLIKNNANVDTMDEKRCPAIFHAIIADHPKCVKALLRAGIGVKTWNINPDTCFTMLGLAVHRGSRKSAEFLLSHPEIDPDEEFIVHSYKRTALSLAIGLEKKGIDTKMIDLLLACPRLDIDKRIDVENMNITALVLAVDHVKQDVVKRLIAAGADVNVRYSDARIPVIRTAAGRGNMNIFLHLLSAGADLWAEDDDGNNVVETAREFNQHHIIRYVEQEIRAKNASEIQAERDERRKRLENRELEEIERVREQEKQARLKRHVESLQRKTKTVSIKPESPPPQPPQPSPQAPPPPPAPKPIQTPSPRQPSKPRPTPQQQNTKTKTPKTMCAWSASTESQYLPKPALSLADYVPELAKVDSPPKPCSKQPPTNIAMPPLLLLPPPASSPPQPSSPSPLSPPAPPPPPKPASHITFILDGLNIGRSSGYIDNSDRLREFVAQRERDGVWGKPCHASAIIKIIEHIDNANERNSGTTYTTLCTLPEYYCFGGKHGLLFAFEHTKLLENLIRSRLVLTPAHFDDDRVSLKLLRDKSTDGACYIISNDAFAEYRDAFSDAWHVRFAWVGDGDDVVLCPPQGVDLPGL